MEYIACISRSIEEICFACLGSSNFVEDITENEKIQNLFMKTFNLKLDINKGFPRYLCEQCHWKLNEASQFLAKVQTSIQQFEELQKNKVLEDEAYVDLKHEEHIILDTVGDIDNEENKSYESEHLDTNQEDISDSGSDNEPLIRLVPKTRKRKINTFNPKLKRIPVPVIEEVIQAYRDRCKDNSNCKLCEFKGFNVRNLSCHMTFKHKEEKQNWCCRCNKMVDNLENHKKTHLKTEWCIFCKKNITRCHYLEHLKCHAGLNFLCGKCDKKYMSQKDLDEHMAHHKANKPFRCHFCGKAFKLLKSLEDHTLTHGRYKCEVCEKNFEIPELLASHLCSGKVVKKEQEHFLVLQSEAKNSETEPEVFYVLGDGVDFDESPVKNERSDEDIKNNSDNNCKDDVVKVKPDRQVESLTCHFCQRTYKTPHKLQKHIEAHMGIFLAKCKYCDKGFSCKADLVNHERVHTKEKPFICSTCGKGFVSGATLRVHMIQHTGKTEECELCEKRFCRPSELKLHLQKHRGERPFLCTDCGKSFAQKSHLTCHLAMHSEERPYSCTKCDKAFKKKELLKHHMKLHGEKRFKCTACFYECHKKYRLQQHYKMHEGKTGMKIISCQLCSRAFSTVQLMNSHMSNAHNVIM